MQPIRVILVRTTHAGNIGSVARAMKTMGLTELYLVEPKSFPDKEANIMASHADDVLDNAVVVSSLDEALADCQLIFATSARQREIDWPVVTPRAAAEHAQAYAQQSPQAKVAVLFGAERTGLLNVELQRAHYHIVIPANPDYASLNLAQAVQVIAYELRVAGLSGTATDDDQLPSLADAQSVEQLYVHLQEGLQQVGFLKANNRDKHQALMTRLKRLFQRAQLQADEVTILRGICSAMQNKQQ